MFSLFVPSSSAVGLGPPALLFVCGVNSSDDMFHPVFYVNNEL